MAESELRISAIYTYPIKSLRGCSPASLKATPTGFAYDRRFMLMRASDGQNMHVSEFTEMCLFTTELVRVGARGDSVNTELVISTTSGMTTAKEVEPDTIIVRYAKDHVFDKPEEKLYHSTPGDVDDEQLHIPLQPDVKGMELDTVEVTMHSSSTTGYDMGDHFNSWFSRRLGYGIHLLYLGDNRRKVLGNITPHHDIHKNGASASSSDGIQGEKGNGWFTALSTAAGSLVSTLTNPVSAAVASNNNDNTGQDNHKKETSTSRGIDTGISFADCAPYLVVTTKSFENTSARLLPSDEKMDMTKYRPNIVVDGARDDFEEDFWAHLYIFGHTTDTNTNTGSENDSDGMMNNQKNGLQIQLTANCARCNSLNVDYKTGKVGTGETGKILKKLQRDRRVDLGAKYSPVFGRYGFLAYDRTATSKTDDENFTIHVGDRVKVVKRNDSHTRFQWPSLSTDK